MYRLAIERLKDWYNLPNRKPLILRGARQVGKTVLVRLFAKELKLSLIEINLEKYPYLNTIFKSLSIDNK